MRGGDGCIIETKAGLCKWMVVCRLSEGGEGGELSEGGVKF